MSRFTGYNLIKPSNGGAYVIPDEVVAVFDKQDTPSIKTCVICLKNGKEIEVLGVAHCILDQLERKKNGQS